MHAQLSSTVVIDRDGHWAHGENAGTTNKANSTILAKADENMATNDLPWSVEMGDVLGAMQGSPADTDTDRQGSR